MNIAQEEIQNYNQSQTDENRKICELLLKEIDKNLHGSNSMLYHGSPVWFINDNPIVGYYVKAKGGVQLLFWSGKSFEESDLKPMGKHKAAEFVYYSVDEIDKEKLANWLEKSRKIQWDYKNIRENKGELVLMK